MLKVKILKHNCQRNGVGGEPFIYFLISWKDENKVKRTGIASLTVDEDYYGEYPEKFNGSCRVVTPDNFDMKWRGDVFEHEIRKQHKIWF